MVHPVLPLAYRIICSRNRDYLGRSAAVRSEDINY